MLAVGVGDGGDDYDGRMTVIMVVMVIIMMR